MTSFGMKFHGKLQKDATQHPRGNLLLDLSWVHACSCLFLFNMTSAWLHDRFLCVLPCQWWRHFKNSIFSVMSLFEYLYCIIYKLRVSTRHRMGTSERHHRIIRRRRKRKKRRKKAGKREKGRWKDSLDLEITKMRQIQRRSEPSLNQSRFDRCFVTGGFAHHIQTLLQQSSSSSSIKSARFCPCCGWSGPIFQTVPWGQVRPDGLCPQCQSCERHRRTSPTNSAFRLLHFGPQKHMEQELMAMKGASNNASPIDQIGLDYFAGSYKE